MKKVIKYSLLIVAVFVINLVSVDAKIFTTDNTVPNNSYVIGTHVFTSDTELTMQKIMYASKTISSDNLDDMVIYYKDPWGDWYDAVLGIKLDVNDSSFTKKYLNLEEYIRIPTPYFVINKIKNKNEDGSLVYSVSSIGYSGPWLISPYCSETIDGVYTKVTNTNEFSYKIINDERLVTIQANKKYYCKLKVTEYWDSSTRTELDGDFSNIVLFDTTTTDPKLFPEFSVFVTTSGGIVTGYKYYINVPYGKYHNLDIASFKLYMSKTSSGEYSELYNYEFTDSELDSRKEFSYKSYGITIPRLETYYFKAIYYNSIGDKIFETEILDVKGKV